MKILLAPDKFKGTLTAQEVCDALAVGLKSYSNIEIKMLPLADGGEGTQDIFIKHRQGKRISVEVHDPLMRPIQVQYATSANQKTAFIEMAIASGLSLLKPEERKPVFTTTFGTGEAIRHALDTGAEEIFLAIGGSATNDAGLGLLSALGVRMLDGKDQEFIPRGGTMMNIRRMDFSLLHSRARDIKFTALCDVQNPFYGKDGAAYIYAPQKGATHEQVIQLDSGLQHVAELILKQTGIDLQHISGAGAGGGIAGGLHALLNAQLTRGIDVVFELTNFHKAIQWADVVITGEGKVDTQTLQGKLVDGVINQTKKQNKRAVIVCGQSATPNFNQTPVYSLSERFGMEEALKNPAKALKTLAGIILMDITRSI